MKILYYTIPVLFVILTAYVSRPDVPKRKHVIIMQLTQGDSATQISVIGQLRNIKRAMPESQIEVVCHANALDLLNREKSIVQQHITELSAANITFAACENTMSRKRVNKDDLVREAITVPSGLAEIVLKQEDGWHYVKGGS